MQPADTLSITCMSMIPGMTTHKWITDLEAYPRGRRFLPCSAVVEFSLLNFVFFVVLCLLFYSAWTALPRRMD